MQKPEKVLCQIERGKRGGEGRGSQKYTAKEQLRECVCVCDENSKCMTRHGGRNQALNNLATGRTIKFELKCHTHAFAYDLPGSDADASSDVSSDALQCHVLWLVILLLLLSLLLLHSAQCEASGKSAVPTVLCLCHSPLFPSPSCSRCAKFTV